MTFFIAPAGYKDNPGTKTNTSGTSTSNSKVSSSSGGGCISIRNDELGIRNVLFVLLMGFFMFAFIKHERR